MSSDSRGVSELLGFILSFSIIILSIGVVYVGGYSAIVDELGTEHLNNADQAMSTLAENLDDIERGAAPSRAGEIRLSGGTLSIEQSSRFAVTVAHENGTLPVNVSTGSIRYTHEGNVISYENGALFRIDAGEKYLRRAPTLLCRDDRAIISMVEIERRTGPTSLRSADSVLLLIDKQDAGVYYPMRENETVVNEASAAHNVTVRVDTSPHGAAWNQWLEARDGWDRSSEGYTCEADAVFVRKTVVDARLFQ